MRNLDLQLAKFAKSARFKQMVATKQKDAVSAGKSFGQGAGAISVASAIAAGERLRDLLYEEITDFIPSIEKSHILVGEPTATKDGNYTIEVLFDRQFMKRSSLYPEKYDGVENIVLHFTHGWSAKDSVYGTWHGHSQMSRSYFAGDGFIQQAVARFNREFDGTAQADMNQIYE